MRMPWYEDKGEQGEYKNQEAYGSITRKRWLDAGQSGHDMSVLYYLTGSKVQSPMPNSSETGAVQSSEFGNFEPSSIPFFPVRLSLRTQNIFARLVFLASLAPRATTYRRLCRWHPPLSYC